MTQDPNWGGASGGGYGNQQGGFSGGGSSGANPKNTLWLILNLAAIFLCWAGGLFSLIGAIFAGIGLSKEKTDIADATSKAKIAKILFAISVVIGLIGWAFLIGGTILAGSAINEINFSALSGLESSTNTIP